MYAISASGWPNAGLGWRRQVDGQHVPRSHLSWKTSMSSPCRRWYHHPVVISYPPVSSILEKMMRVLTAYETWMSASDAGDWVNQRLQTILQDGKPCLLKCGEFSPLSSTEKHPLKPPPRCRDNQRCPEVSRMGPPKIRWGSWGFVFLRGLGWLWVHSLSFSACSAKTLNSGDDISEGWYVLIWYHQPLVISQPPVMNTWETTFLRVYLCSKTKIFRILKHRWAFL